MTGFRSQPLPFRLLFTEEWPGFLDPRSPQGQQVIRIGDPLRWSTLFFFFFSFYLVLLLLFLENVKPALKSCQALGPEVRNSKRQGRVPEDITEAQRLGVPLEEPHCRSLEPNLGQWGRSMQMGNLPFSEREGPTCLPSGHGAGLRACLQPAPQARKGCLYRDNSSFNPSVPRRQPTQPSTLGLPTPVQNKVLRLLMIKMSPARCPSSVGL